MQNEIGIPASKPGLEHLLRIKAYSPMIIMSLCERCSSYQAKLGFENEAPSSSVDTPRAQLPGGLIVCPGIPELCQICLAPAICACKISWNQPECTGHFGYAYMCWSVNWQHQFLWDFWTYQLYRIAKRHLSRIWSMLTDIWSYDSSSNLWFWNYHSERVGKWPLSVGSRKWPSS